jgi:hypothetical protein
VTFPGAVATAFPAAAGKTVEMDVAEGEHELARQREQRQ